MFLDCLSLQVNIATTYTKNTNTALLLNLVYLWYVFEVVVSKFAICIRFSLVGSVLQMIMLHIDDHFVCIIFLF